MKYIVTWIIYGFTSLPQCDMGNGFLCATTHVSIYSKQKEAVFCNKDSAINLFLKLNNRDTCQPGFFILKYNYPDSVKLDSVRIVY